MRELTPGQNLPIGKSGHPENILIKQGWVFGRAGIPPSIGTFGAQIVRAFCDADFFLRICSQTLLHCRHVPAEFIGISLPAKIQQAHSVVRPKMNPRRAIRLYLLFFHIFRSFVVHFPLALPSVCAPVRSARHRTHAKSCLRLRSSALRETAFTDLRNLFLTPQPPSFSQEPSRSEG